MLLLGLWQLLGTLGAVTMDGTTTTVGTYSLNYSTSTQSLLVTAGVVGSPTATVSAGTVTFTLYSPSSSVIATVIAAQ